MENENAEEQDQMKSLPLVSFYGKVVQRFDKTLALVKKNTLELGRLAYSLKQAHASSGKRMAGEGWKAFCESRGLNVDTVDKWILTYERTKGIKPPKETKEETEPEQQREQEQSAVKPPPDVGRFTTTGEYELNEADGSHIEVSKPAPAKTTGLPRTKAYNPATNFAKFLKDRYDLDNPVQWEEMLMDVGTAVKILGKGQSRAAHIEVSRDSDEVRVRMTLKRIKPQQQPTRQQETA
jgi:hypothetical protein